MSGNKNEHAVVALFDDAAAANAAIDKLKKWDAAAEEIKLGAIGIISKDGDKIKTNSGRKTGKGAKAGAVVGVIAGVLSGGLTLVAGAVGGTVLGAVGGSFFKKSLALSKEEIQQIGVELDAGRVAVVVACDDDEVEATSAQLAQAGGKVRNYAMPEGTMAETAAAMEAAAVATPEASAGTADAAPEASTEETEAAPAGAAGAPATGN